MNRNIKILMFVFAAVGVLLACGSKTKADFTFGTPQKLGPTVNSSRLETEPSISSDGLELYFDSSRSGGYGNWDLWVSTRETTEDDWNRPVNLGSKVNTSSYDLAPSISADGLSLYFNSNRSGSWHTWITTRAAKDQPWETPMRLGPPVNVAGMNVAYISPDGLELYIGSERPGGYGNVDLWVSTRATTENDWGEPVNLGPTVNTTSGEIYSSISAHGLILFFSGGDAPHRAGGYGEADIWMTTRKTKDDDWGTPMNLGPTVNSSSIDRAPSISADGSTLYFCSDRSGGNDLWQVPILPIVDFNADGIVDADDMCVIVNHWGQNYPICDIGPTPWGDGIVDVQDLIILSEHLFEEAGESKLIAHWAFDETEGMYAADSIGENDAIVMGGTWQPGGGKVDGALQLDGVIGSAIVNSVLSTADGSFSIFAWVKGGAPGQVIVSQQMVASWLAIDAEGKLITELKSSDPLAGLLHSEAVITDGQWHKIGLAWDGLHRTLIVDGAIVAEDTQPGLEDSQMGLYLGVDKNYTSGTFFSGLIDDVRIYSRAVSP